MAKKPTSDAISRGEELLREWQVSDQIDALRSAWGRDPGADLAIVARLGRRGDADTAAFLVELEVSGPSKVLRKEIRRVLFRLQQRGVSIPERPVSPAPAAFVPTSPLEGYMSGSDGVGDQLLWLVKPRPGGLAHLFAVINDPAGMREVDLNIVSRKILRGLRADLLRKHEIEIVPVDPAYCDHRMSQAYVWANERGQKVQGDYIGFRAQLLRDPPAEVAHPIFARIDADRVRSDASLVEQGARLLEEREFRTWLLTEEILRPHIEKLEQAMESPLILDRHQQQERMGEVVAEAIAGLFGGEHQASYVRRLLDLAYVFHATHRPAQAESALATALALESSREGGKGVLFCEALVQLSLSLHAKATAEQRAEEAKSSLIITPQEARASMERRRS